MASDPLSQLRAARRRWHVVALLLASMVALLAYASPVDMSDADAGVALLVSRTLLREGTFDLASSLDDPLVSYDLEQDYRIRPDGEGGYFYYSYGVPLLSLPAVALAEAGGFDLRMREQEADLQNLISALVCGILVLLLYRLLSYIVEPPVAFAVTLVSMLGSPLVSTLGTALWNTGYQLFLLLVASILLVRRKKTPVLLVLGLVGLAAICRPTTGFFGVALLAFLVRTSESRFVRHAAVVGLLGIGLVLIFAASGVAGFLPLYYDPMKLFKTGEPVEGAIGLMLSPSRGLLVYSPFLAIVFAGSMVTLRRIWKDPLLQFAAIWIVTHLAAVAAKRTWWGGHAFGPRLLAEILPAFAIVTVLVWRELRGTTSARRWATSYLALGLVAIAIHSGAGLFNSWTVQWNERPNIDVVPEELFNWNYPQFLATEEGVAQRELEIQRRTRRPYVVGETIDSGSRSAAVFEGWSPLEGSWRWTREPLASIAIEAVEPEPAALFLLEIEAGANGSQRVRARWNRASLGELLFEGFERQGRLLALPSHLLRAGENRLQLELPDASPTRSDSRWLGLALHSFRIRSLPADFDGFDYRDDAFFRSGFSEAEASWRWTDGKEAHLSIPVVRESPRPDVSVLLRVAAFGRQEVELLWDGVTLGKLEVDGFQPVDRRLLIDASLLEVGVLHDLEMRIPSPGRAAGDPRELGLAFVSIELQDWHGGEVIGER